MTPKLKAKELVGKFKQHSKVISSGFLVPNEDTSIKSAVQCALIAVEEILKIERLFCENKEAKMSGYSHTSSIEYWQEVKQEIEKV